MIARFERLETKRRKGPLLYGRGCVHVGAFAEAVALHHPNMVTGRPLFEGITCGCEEVRAREGVRACVLSFRDGLITPLSLAQIKQKSRAAQGKTQGLCHVTLLA